MLQVGNHYFGVVLVPILVCVASTVLAIARPNSPVPCLPQGIRFATIFLVLFMESGRPSLELCRMFLLKYIATPKPNGYQSLHTTVIPFLYESMFLLEFQIRMADMDLIADRCIAAHYSGKGVVSAAVQILLSGLVG